MMQQTNEDLTTPSDWINSVKISIKFLFIFYISTLLLVLFFIHRPGHWIIPGISLGIIYLFVIGVSLYRLIKKLPIAVIMLAAPTIPLLMLIIIVSMIPLF